MLFQRHDPSLPLVTPQSPSQNVVPCHPALNEPDGLTDSVSARRVAHLASIFRYIVCSLPRTAALLASFCAFFCATTSAQNAQFASAMSTIANSGTDTLSGIAVDLQGNLYFADWSKGEIWIETLSGGVYNQSVLTASALVDPGGVAVDQNGNVYIADTGNSRVLMETLTNGSYTESTLASAANGLSKPYGIAVDGSGNVYIADLGGDELFMDSKGSPGYTMKPIAGSSAGLTKPDAVAVDIYGNIYVADAGSSQVLKFNAGNYAESTVANAANNGLNQPYGIAVDASGNVYISDTENRRVLMETLNGGTYIQSVILPPTQFSPLGLAADGAGNIYISGSFKGSSIQGLVLKDSPSGANFGTVAIGKTSPAISLIFTFSAQETISAPNVGTQGGSGFDFANAGTGTCVAGTYAAGSSCGIDVTFMPQYSGNRYGAASLIDQSSGKTIAWGYATGVGFGPQINFLPGTQEWPITGVATTGIAVDSFGNMYGTDGTLGQLALIAPGQTAAQATVIVSGMVDGAGVAVDGAGNVYVADAGANAIGIAVPATNGTYSVSGFTTKTPLSSPQGVAVDTWGNVYIADTGNSRVIKETLSGGNLTETIVVEGIGGPSAPQGVAVDASGNVYIADTGNDRVLKETPGANGYYTQTVVPTQNLGQPVAVAVDGNGNLYIADYGSNTIWKEIFAGAGSTQSAVSTPNMYKPLAVAVAPTGNVYIADSGNSDILEVDLSDPPSLSFASTAQGQTSSPQTVTVADIGTLPLFFSAFTYPADFPAAGGTSNGCSTSTILNQNDICTLTIDFSPTGSLNGSSSAPLSESVWLTSNNLNVASAKQFITVTGTEIAPPAAAATPAFAWPTGTYNAAIEVAIADTTPGAVIYWNIGDSNPTTNSTLYTGSITVSSTEIVNAIAVAPGYSQSAVASATYTQRRRVHAVAQAGRRAASRRTACPRCESAWR